MDENNSTPQPENVPAEQSPEPAQEIAQEIVVAPQAGPAGHGSSPQEPASASPGRPLLGVAAPRRVLQPSASFVQELRANATTDPKLPERPERPEQPIPPVQSSAPQPTDFPAEPSAPLSPLEPAAEPVATIATPVQASPAAPDHTSVPPPAIGQAQWHHSAPATETEAEQQPTGAKNTTILVGIYVLGAIITLGSAYNLYRWTHIRGLAGISVEQVVSILLSLTLLAAGFGILRRKELGRIVYVFLAIISLVLSLWGTARLYHQLATVQKALPAKIAYIQASEDDMRANSDLPQDSKQALLANYDQQIADLKKQQGNTLLKTFGHLPGYIAIDYAIAILPIVFLTRASARAKFDN